MYICMYVCIFYIHIFALCPHSAIRQRAVFMSVCSGRLITSPVSLWERKGGADSVHLCLINTIQIIFLHLCLSEQFRLLLSQIATDRPPLSFRKFPLYVDNWTWKHCVEIKSPHKYKTDWHFLCDTETMLTFELIRRSWLWRSFMLSE